MLINFFLTLRKYKVPATIRELMDLLEALQARLAYSDIDDFYLLSRTTLCKDEKNYDKFDRAFAAYFKGLEDLHGMLEALIPEEWLRREFEKTLTPEELEKIKSLADESTTKRYKNRFMVKVGDHIRSITTDQVLFFYADGRDVYLVTQQLRKFIIDFTLESLEEVLEPKTFFRANRTYILNIQFIHDVVMYSNSRLKIATQPAWDKEIIVSREKVGEFKEWFDGQEK